MCSIQSRWNSKTYSKNLKLPETGSVYCYECESHSDYGDVLISAQGTDTLSRGLQWISGKYSLKIICTWYWYTSIYTYIYTIKIRDGWNCIYFSEKKKALKTRISSSPDQNLYYIVAEYPVNILQKLYVKFSLKLV